MVKKQEISYKKKYGWLILYVFLIIIGQKLAGIGGVIGAIIISFGISKTCRNSDLSNTKRWIYSILYILGGIITAYIVVLILMGALSGIFGSNALANVNSEKNIEANYTIDVGFKTYKNSNMEISALSYPADWTATDSKDKYSVIFNSLNNITYITITLYGLEQGKKFDLTKVISDLANEDQADNSWSFEKTKEEIKTLNEKDWLIFEGVFYTGNIAAYEKIGYVLTGKYDGRQYLEVVMATNKSNFVVESAKFDKIIDSLRLYS